MKTCKDCGVEKDKSSFYGIQGECKDCTKKRISKNYIKNKSHYAEYDVLRNQRPERKKARLRYQQKQRSKNPHKYLARQKVLRALDKGLLKKKPCKVCKDVKVEAHHTDYTKPLLVIWLCRKHHREADKKLCLN